MLVPTRRASGEAVQLMLCHALGEAGAPYIIGVMAGTIENNLVGEPSHNPSQVFKENLKDLKVLYEIFKVHEFLSLEKTKE